MSQIGDMRERHKREIEELQLNCPHEELEGWMKECWDPAHGTGREVRPCKECGTVVETKTTALTRATHQTQRRQHDNGQRSSV